MTDVERFLGRFDEFQRWEDKQHENIEKRLDTIEQKVDSLRLWKASIMGMAALIGAVSGFITSFLGR